MLRGRLRGSDLPSFLGPVLIALLVLVVLHDVVFGARISSRNPDLLAFWMPNQCFLTQELGAGRIPYWNPHALSGTPFAADPQSGWLYFPMMLFAFLPCDVGVRALIVSFPLLGGLGTYFFLRGEGISRAGSSVGGACVAGLIAGSALAVTFTFVGFVAWTPWVLAAASRSVRAAGWSGRLAWSAITALLWGQLAAAHISNGLVMGSALLALFAAYKGTTEMRAGRLKLTTLLSAGCVLLVLLVVVNLGYLLPRIMYLQRSSIGLGYEGLFELRNQLWGLGSGERPPSVRVTEPEWILRLATSPGAYLGVIPLALSFAGLFVRRLRALTIVLWVYVVAFYLAGLKIMATTLRPLLEDTFVGDFYLHTPARFSYAPILGLCLLAGIGVDAWRDSPRKRVMVIPGLVLWGVLPLLAGASASHLILPAITAAIALPLLVLTARRAIMWTGLVVILSMELSINALHGQSGSWTPDDHGLTDPNIVGVEPLPEPDLDAVDLTSRLPLLESFDSVPGERWITMHPALTDLGRQMIHGINEAQGYNPVQLRRYWTYTRALGQGAIDRSPRHTLFREIPSPATLDLLHVHYIAELEDVPPTPGATKVSEADPWSVWELPETAPAATIFSDYTSVSVSPVALDWIVDPGFDPSRELVVENAPAGGSTSSGGPRPVHVEWRNPSTLEAQVEGQSGFLLLRVPYDRYWTATVDGRATQIAPADYFLQGVAVEEGDDVVRFAYRDPWVTRGLWGSALALATVAAVCAALRYRARRRGVEDEPER